VPSSREGRFKDRPTEPCGQSYEMGKMTQRELKNFVVAGRRGRLVVLVPLEVASLWAARGLPDDEFREEGRGVPTLSPSFPAPPEGRR
jgi:hypothetical protein